MQVFMAIIKMVLAFLASFFRQFVPALFRKYDFIFLAHPRHMNDVYTAFPLLKKLKKKQMHKFLLHMWPLFTSEIDTGLTKKDGKPLRGRFVTISATPEMILRKSDPVRTKIGKAVIQARNLGARTVGVGALLPAVIAGGKKIEVPEEMAVTTGYAFSVLIVRKNLETISSLFDIDIASSRIAVVGASQKIGYHIALSLAPEAGSLLLYDQPQKRERLEELAAAIEEKNPGKPACAAIAESQADLLAADLILVFTSALSTRLKSENLAPGTIIIDDTQPNAVPRALADEREDILVLDGGLVSLPGFNPHFRFGLLKKEDMWGCLGETILLSWIKSRNGNRPVPDYADDPEAVMALYREAYEEIGFEAAEIRSFSRRRLTEDKIGLIRKHRAPAAAESRPETVITL